MFTQENKEALETYYYNELVNGAYDVEYQDDSGMTLVNMPPIDYKKQAIKLDFFRHVKPEEPGFFASLFNSSPPPGSAAYPFSQDQLHEMAFNVNNDELNAVAGEIAQIAIQRFINAAPKLKKTDEEIYGNNTVSAESTQRLQEKVDNTVKDKDKNIFGETPTEGERSDRARQNRLSEQAALILSMEEIWSLLSSGSVHINEREFQNFSPIRYSGSVAPTGHSFLSSYYTKTPEMSAFFNNLPPQVMSFLIPSIKLYKTFFPTISGSSDAPNNEKQKGYDWRIPFDDVPIAFTNQASSIVPTVDGLEKILSGESGFHAAGIKSFNYEYRGTNPAEINTNIHASLTLYFQSPAELIKDIDVSFSDPRFIQAIPKGNYNQMKFRYSELFNSQARRTIDGGKEKFNDKYYRIKIVCGYSDINVDTLKEVMSAAGYDENFTLAVYKAIVSSKVILFLSPYRYDLNFQEDGSLELKIDYNASIDTILSSDKSDIFKLSDSAQANVKLLEIIENFLTYKVKKQNVGDNTAEDPCFSKEEYQKALEAVKKEFKDELPTDEDINKRISEAHRVMYNSINRILLGKEEFHKEKSTDGVVYNVDKIINPKIYQALFKPDLLGINNGEEQATQKRLEAAQSSNNIISVISIVEEKDRPLIPQEANDAKPGDNNAPTQASVAQKVNDELILAQAKVSGQPYNIKFVMLGDIIDIALSCLDFLDEKNDTPRVVIGNIPISLPVIEDINAFHKNPIIFETRPIYPNLADVPISLNLFQDFMIENVVKQQKTKYPVIQFLKDIISQLIFPALQPSVLGNSTAINNSLRFSTSYLTFPTSGAGKDMIAGGRDARIRKYPPTIDEKTVETIKNLKFYGKVNGNIKITQPDPALDKTQILKMVNYVFITCSSRFPAKHLLGDEKDDLSKGVLHFRMGTETGIIKKVNFERMNTPYQREMIARQEGRGFGTSLKQFYNANVEMFGNDIFRPGDYIYIHPNYAYNKRVIDLEENLGLGGYYLVLDVQTNIEEGAYNTKIKCVFQATAKKNKKAEKIVEDFTAPCNRG